jgi:hypothetical protein
MKKGLIFARIQHFSDFFSPFSKQNISKNPKFKKDDGFVLLNSSNPLPNRGRQRCIRVQKSWDIV